MTARITLSKYATAAQRKAWTPRTTDGIEIRDPYSYTDTELLNALALHLRCGGSIPEEAVGHLRHFARYTRSKQDIAKARAVPEAK